MLHTYIGLGTLLGDGDVGCSFASVQKHGARVIEDPVYLQAAYTFLQFHQREDDFYDG